jgi:hypothetical protein
VCFFDQAVSMSGECEVRSAKSLSEK